MKIVIVGCGRVGAAIAETYDRNGEQVLILDISTAAFDRLPSSFSGEALRGDGTDEDVLRRAGAEGADVFLAVTEGDNRNVMAAQLASEALGIGRVIAKINDPVRAAAYSELGIATLCRTGLMMDAIGDYLGLPTSGLPGMLAPSGSHHDPSHGLLATVGSAIRIGRGRQLRAGRRRVWPGGSSAAGGSSGAAGTGGSGAPRYGRSGSSPSPPVRSARRAQVVLSVPAVTAVRRLVGLVGSSASSGTGMSGSASTGMGPGGAVSTGSGSDGSGSAGSDSDRRGRARGGVSGAPSGGNGGSRFFGASRFLGGSRTAAASPPGAAAGAPVDPAAPPTRREV